MKYPFDFSNLMLLYKLKKYILVYYYMVLDHIIKKLLCDILNIKAISFTLLKEKVN